MKNTRTRILEFIARYYFFFKIIIKHGLNRTGYMIIMYLIMTQNKMYEEALKTFETSRRELFIKYKFTEYFTKYFDYSKERTRYMNNINYLINEDINLNDINKNLKSNIFKKKRYIQPKNCLIIKNLPVNTEIKDILSSKLNEFKEILSIKIMYDESMNCKGIAYLKYENTLIASNSKYYYDNVVINGNLIFLDFSTLDFDIIK
jgi:hypothetical protein